jgi:hypothetical protein
MPSRPAPKLVSKAEHSRLLRRAGYSSEIIREVHAQVADPIDLGRDATTLGRYGITGERLMDLLGGSP